MTEYKKQFDCGLIQDLLPLYQDQVCSESSKNAVESHLEDCSVCRTMAEKLKDTSYVSELTSEKNSVLHAYEKKEKRRTTTIGIITAGILMIPLIVCLICNLAIGHGLDWFFIVLASLTVFASLTVLPMMVPSNKGLWTLGGFTASLLLLLLVCSIYTKGNWFILAAVPVILGLSVVFLPFVIRKIPLPAALQNKKALLVMVWDTIWLLAVILIGVSASSAAYWQTALAIAVFCLTLPWAMFICIRYFKLHPLIKAGVLTFLSGLFIATSNDVINWILGMPFRLQLLQFNLQNWNTDQAINANSYFLSLVCCTAIGVILLLAGIVKSLSAKKNK